MNYLAHLLLAEPTEDSRLGALIGDFMRGCAIEDFAPGVRAGIERHRRVDELTDAHPVFRRSRARLPAELQRFSGVVVDVAYDHFLAAGWEQFEPAPLRAFADSAYGLLERRRDELPPRLQAALPWIVGRDWLHSYADLPHLERVFAGMARRVRRTNPLPAAFAAVDAEYEGLAADFAEFFPELKRALD